MILTNEQIQQAIEKFALPSGYINLPGFGLFTREEIMDGVEKDLLVFRFDRGRLYVSLAGDEDLCYRQEGKRKVAYPSLNADRAYEWLESIHPSMSSEEIYFTDATEENENLQDWLGAQKS